MSKINDNIKPLSEKEVRIISELEFDSKYYFKREDIKHHFDCESKLSYTIHRLISKKRIVKHIVIIEANTCLVSFISIPPFLIKFIQFSITSKCSLPTTKINPPLQAASSDSTLFIRIICKIHSLLEFDLV